MIKLRNLKGFFRSTINITILGISLVACFAIFLYFSNLKPIQVFPSADTFTFTFFTDTANQGNSVINRHSISDSLIEMDYTLKKGFVDPYVSISIVPIRDSLINLKYYNQLFLDVEGFNTENIGFDIYTPFPSKPGKFISFYDNILEIEHGRKIYVLNFSDLKVPDYWYVANNISPNEKIEPDLANVSHFNIGTAYTNNFDVNRSLKIHVIRFERNNDKLLLSTLVIELIIIVLIVFFHFIRSHKSNKKNHLSIEYKPVEIEDNYKQKTVDCLAYINTNFSNANLSLEKAASDLGIPKRNITIKIQETYGSNFKTYLNKLRIHESKRLLKGTDLSMAEIAEKVGFNTQSHFNRVFKSIEGLNPTDFKNIDN